VRGRYEVLLEVEGDVVWVPAVGDGYRSAVLHTAARAGVSPPEEATVRKARERRDASGSGSLTRWTGCAAVPELRPGVRTRPVVANVAE
jgi:hypothetical protein